MEPLYIAVSAAVSLGNSRPTEKKWAAQENTYKSRGAVSSRGPIPDNDALFKLMHFPCVIRRKTLVQLSGDRDRGYLGTLPALRREPSGTGE